MPYEKYTTSERQERFEPITDREFETLIRKLKNPEGAREMWTKGLNKLLKAVSEKTNNELGTNLLNPDGTIRMNSFKKGEGGPYKNEGEFKKDKHFVEEMDKKWSRKSGQTAAEFLEEREFRHGSLWEKAVTIVFNKILKSNFIAARASRFDDYANGIDTLIIDKETGEVICAFDEVSAEKESEIDKNKCKKVEEKNESGGAKIKYGITFEEGKLIKGAIDNIPVFSLRLSGSELIETLQKMNFDSLKKMDESELKLFDKLMLSMEKQIEGFQDIKIIKDKKDNLLKSLKKMKDLKEIFKN